MYDRKKVHKLNLPISDLHFLDHPITVGSDELAPGRDKFYFEFTLLHSFPYINSNGATFAYPLLKRFGETARYSPIDLEHQIQGSPIFEGENLIIGAIIDVIVPELAEGENPLSPTEGRPIKCIGVLWGRLENAKNIVEDLQSGVEWRVSMEVDRDWDRDLLMTVSKVIKQDDEAWDEAYGAWIQGKEFEGEKIGLALGGTGQEEKDYANFWGAGVVWSPADENAKIHDFYMAPAIANDKQKFIGIATTQKPNQETGAMDHKIVITTDTNLEGTTIEIDGKLVENSFDGLSLFLEQYGRSEYFDLSWWSTVEDGSIVKHEHYYFDPSIGQIIKTEGDKPMKTLTFEELRIEMDKHASEMAKKFEGFKSPEEFATAVQDIEDKYTDYLSPEEFETAVKARVDEIQADSEINEKGFSTRREALTKAGLEITPEREDKLKAYALDEAGNKDFDNWVEQLKSGQEAMIKELEKNKVEVTDEVKKTLSAIDGLNDPRFRTAVAVSIGARGESGVETPGSAANDDETIDINAV